MKLKYKTINLYVNKCLSIATIIKTFNSVKQKLYYYNNIYVLRHSNNIIISNNIYSNIDIRSKTKIDTIISYSKGKGFCGVIKKHNFSSNRQTHGNSKAHNKPGSIGMCQTPGRILKGKKMAGRLGNNKINKRHINILLIYNNIIIIKGYISGSNNSKIIINE